MTFTIGNSTLAYWAMGIPAITSILLWWSIWLRRASYTRRFNGMRLLWEMWISTLLFTLVLFALFYAYLFWNKFYTISTFNDSPWTLSYLLPAHTYQLPTAEIHSIEIVPEQLPLPFIRKRRAHLVIQTSNGASFWSAADADPAALSAIRNQLLQIRN